MKTRKIIAAIAALSLMTSAFSCGSTSSSSEKANNAPVTGAADNTEANSENASSSDTTEGKSEKSTEKTTKEGSSEKSTEAVTSDGEKASEDETEPDEGGNTETEATTEKAASGGNDTPQTTTKASSGGTVQPTEAPTEQNSDDEEKTYTAEVTLGSDIKFTGENVEVDGSKVIINGGGDYIFSGKLTDGQIYVSTKTEEKVTVVLNGVDIHCTTGPAIMINEAKKCTVKVKEGSVNNLSDETKDKVNDGVIFSNDTLRIKGNGTLNITANNSHGLASDDDVIIENGIVNITAKKSGILAHDDITLNGGTLNITGGTNGIKSKGTININGGTAYITGGSKEEKSSVYSAMGFNYTGGYLYAAGNMVTVPTTSSNPFIVVDLGGNASAGTAVKLMLGSSTAAEWTPEKDFRSIMMLSPDIAAGGKFTLYLDGEEQDEFDIEEGQNLFEL